MLEGGHGRACERIFVHLSQVDIMVREQSGIADRSIGIEKLGVWRGEERGCVLEAIVRQERRKGSMIFFSLAVSSFRSKRLKPLNQ